MNLVFRFKKSDDFEKMGALVAGMRNMVIQKAQGNETLVPQKKWTAFIDSLIHSIEEKSYWTVAQKEATLPPDELVEFTSMASAVALAALSLDLQSDSPHPGADQCFTRGAMAFSITGHGEDSMFQVCELLLVLLEGNVPAYVQSLKDCPLKDHLVFWKNHITGRLNTGKTEMPYGGDYREVFQQIELGLDVVEE